MPVDLAGRAYEVVVGPGLLDAAGERIAPLLKRPRLPVVADAAVAELHGARLLAGLERAGVEGLLIPVPPGEGSKSFAELERVLDRLLELRLDRGDVVAAFGGGVIGDLAGLAAALHKRGSPLVQIPTTLLAQVDSAVGGKTAIDTPRGKNLIGAFHQPRLVLAATDVLATLPARELRAGLAEIVKAALIEDAAFFNWLEAHAGDVLALDPEAVTHAVMRAVEIKAAIVAEDEHETTGRRALLNLGHTFAHAFEAEDWAPRLLPCEAGEVDRAEEPGRRERGWPEEAPSVGPLRGPPAPPLRSEADSPLHGEAVALGCALAYRLAAVRGLCPPADAARVGALLARCGLPTHIEDLPRHPSADPLLDRMADDKKSEGGALTLILPRRIGQAFTTRDVDRATLRDFLISEGAQP